MQDAKQYQSLESIPSFEVQKLCRGIEELQLIFRSILEKFESYFFLQTGINFMNVPKNYENYIQRVTP